MSVCVCFLFHFKIGWTNMVVDTDCFQFAIVRNCSPMWGLKQVFCFWAVCFVFCRSKQVTKACKEHGGFYLGSIGGPAAILAQNCIKKVYLR